ncbi:MAG: Sapep family Mn(2+)-dependent dipeptidase, partial [Lachnospiraceae bacterium]|nr:Sapep family Mn(2+)-dependent dipeptidase [Lachnospiraceae bacterium]
MLNFTERGSVKMTLNEIIDVNHDNIVQTLREVVRIPSVQAEAEEGAPYGKNVRSALDYMLNKAKELGLHTVNFDGQVGYAEYGKGELVAVVAHLDVVPAGDGWIHDPFGGELDGDFIFGRGTVDDKGPAVASLYGLYAVKESGLKINRRIRVMFGTNEETGSGDMEYFFHHGGEQPAMGFTPDGAYPLIYGEKGIVIEELSKKYVQNDAQAKLLEIKGGTAHNVVPSKAYAVIECTSELAGSLEKRGGEGIKFTRTANGVRIDAEGLSAHGSTPEKGINAIGRLINVLNDIPFGDELANGIHFLND